MTLLQVTLVIGLIGAIIMFFGDMLLYYNKEDYVSDGTLQPIIDIMKKESRPRLYAGGMIGPTIAFVYAIGFYHSVLFIDERHAIAGWICFFLNTLGIIIGGSFHSHCANLGLIGRHNDKACIDEVLDFLKVQRIFLFTTLALGVILLAVCIGCGWTVFPRWMAALTPGVFMLLLPVVRKLPKGLHIVIGGGWTNLVFVLYYIAAIIVSF
ncbi:MAG: DUF6796 family protein [Treponemataceae bacterium]